MSAPRTFKRHLSARDQRAKAIIEAVVAAGAGIEFLPDAPRFRYRPATRELDSFKGRENGPPRGRGSIACGRGNVLKLKNWSPSKLDANPMYCVPMKGDDNLLTVARGKWAKGDPSPLRTYLAEAAAKRREAQAECERLFA